MAHNINFDENIDKHSFFSVKEKAWHGLGQIVDQYATSGEAIQHAGLNYQVQKAGLSAVNLSSGNAGENVPVPNYYATMRTENDAVIGIVGNVLS
ncbi:hypothetical protein [Dyadobacter sp. CY323]|uniref:hypothetical protein n=1 Tax=Dyadobacter sp. CY323 TaxID=2907302 RepID=UPI001F47CF41|nr:hypothetical protein [Dyadobacter sp. CY323]MCE6989814.1 hypothetical protein [Dyadobacter sp. CY323]